MQSVRRVSIIYEILESCALIAVEQGIIGGRDVRRSDSGTQVTPKPSRRAAVVRICHLDRSLDPALLESHDVYIAITEELS